MKLAKLAKTLEHLTEEKEILGSDNLSIDEYDELTNIVLEIINSVYQTVNMRKIEERISHARKIDISALKNVIKKISNSNLHTLTIHVEGKEDILINPSELIQEFSDFVNKVEAGKIDRINALFGLELFYDSNFDRLLMTFNENDKIFETIQSVLIEKFQHINNDEMLLFWAKIKSFFNTEYEHKYNLYNDIIPRDFFTEQGKSFDIRKSSAVFIAKYRPLTIRRMVEEGINFFPITLPGVARILAISDTSEISPISNLEYLLIRATSQIVALHESITYQKTNDIAKAVGADRNGLIFNGEFLKNYRERIKDIRNKESKFKLLTLNVKRLIEYAALFEQQMIPIETALWQYKIGQEIIVPARKKEFSDAKGTLEDYLQKDISKFLIEKNILSYGRKNGRSEIDLYYKDIGGEEFVIETNIYTGKNKLTFQKLKRNIIQLQSYMDQVKQPRGILALFNFSDVMILAPKKWLRGRILIISINLCPLPPSKRWSSIEIIESDSDIINFIKLD